MKTINRTIIVLSLVSMAMDMASEMLYPVMPIFLKSIGFGVVFIGMAEGLADAVAGLSKGYFGQLSDNRGRRLPLVKLGYFLSSISKPLMIVFNWAFWVAFWRSGDRFGKGIRTAPRDALLADASKAENRGMVFGFHRALDTLGAVIGPLFALFWLSKNPGDYRDLFYWALIPGLLSVSLLFLIREKPVQAKANSNAKFFVFFSYWNQAGKAYKGIAGRLLLFTLFNSSDVFLLLRVKELGYTDTALIGWYLFYNLIYALAAYPLGKLSDKIHAGYVMATGLVFFAAAYVILGVSDSFLATGAVFMLYGLFAASTEGQAKAWISKICPPSEKATAIGAYLSWQSIALLGASTISGIVWASFGSTVMLLLSGFGALFCSILLLLETRKHSNHLK